MCGVNHEFATYTFQAQPYKVCVQVASGSIDV